MTVNPHQDLGIYYVSQTRLALQWSAIIIQQLRTCQTDLWNGYYSVSLVLTISICFSSSETISFRLLEVLFGWPWTISCWPFSFIYWKHFQFYEQLQDTLKNNCLYFLEVPWWTAQSFATQSVVYIQQPQYYWRVTKNAYS